MSGFAAANSRGMMNFLLKLSRLFWFSLWYLFAALVVLTAAVFGITRLLLPLVGEYNAEIERQATDYVGRPIKIMSLDAEWHGFSPSLVLKNVRVLNNEGTKTILQFSRARLDFSLIKSIKSRGVSFERLALSGVDISLVRQKSGQINLLGFESDLATDTSDADKEFLAKWIFGQGEISLQAKNLLFLDEQTHNRRYHFTDVSLMIRNRNERHLVDGVIAIAGEPTQELAFSLDVTGDFTSINDWSGQFYLKGTHLDFNRVLGDLETNGLVVSVGPSEFELWGRWDKSVLSSLQGDVALRDITLTSSEAFAPVLLLSPNKESKTTKTNSPQNINVHYDQFIARFDWEKSRDGWDLTADQLVIAYDEGIWPSSQIAIHYAKDQQANHAVAVQASLIRIQDVLPVMPILFGRDHEYAQPVKTLVPRGDLQSVNFKWEAAENAFELSAGFKDMQFAPMEAYPGGKDFSGALNAVNNSGQLLLNTTNAVFELPKVFRNAISVKKLSGSLDWEMQNNKFVLSSRDLEVVTNDIAAKGILDLDIPKGNVAPFISLIMNFNDGNASATSAYLPVSIMPKATVEWLDNAILQGHVISGGAILYGSLDEFPFTRGQGVFETRFSLENAMLDYAEEWPRLYDISADVVFRGNTLNITSDHAKIFNNEIDNIDVNIPNLGAKPLRLNIKGQSHGSSQEKLNYLLVSPPLRYKFNNYLSDMKLFGNSDLTLDIKLAFEEELQSVVTGAVEFHNNRLDYKNMNKLLSNMNGKMTLLEHGFSAQKISADLLGQPSVVKIKTTGSTKAQPSDTVRISATGKFDAKSLSATHLPALSDLVSGQSDWFVNLSLPRFQYDQNQDRSVRLSVESSLKGIEMNFPPPFNKPLDQARQLNLRVDFKDLHNALIRISYGGSFDSIFEYDLENGALIKRGETRFGIGPVALPKEKGVRIAGYIDELSFDVWRNLLTQVFVTESSEDTDQKAIPAKKVSQPFTALLHSMDISVGQFEAFGQKASNMKLKVDNKQDWLLAKVKSKEITGQLKIPNDIENDVIVMDLQHWHLSSSETSAGVINPLEIPALSLNSRSVTYNNRKFGHVAMEIAKAENGILLQQIIIKPRETILKGHGAWLIESGQSNSNIEFILESSDLGKTMKDLGFVDTIDDGSGVFNAKLHWTGPLIGMDLEHLQGEVDFKLTDGRILDLEPGGAARLFGLFSLQTLPRRLTLDFSDIFSKGLGFDLIEGQFRIEDGDAYTRNFRLQGPNANIDLKGRIGLATQDYDQKIIVTPHITDATILLSVITSQPILFFLQQLMKEDIEKATSLEYSLTGSWNNFKLEPILKKNVETTEPDEF